MHKDSAALIVRKKTWGDYVCLGLRSPRIAAEAKPGQFLMIRASQEPFPLLRRPFSIHGRETGTVEIFFARTGIGTSILAEKKPGETLDILGPLGNGFRIWRKRKSLGAEKKPARAELKADLRERTVDLVGGGRGIAPLYFLALELRRRGARPRIFYGGRSEPDLPLLEKFASRDFDIFVSTDDGSLGFYGPVTSMLETELRRSTSAINSSESEGGKARGSGIQAGKTSPLPARIFACGPDAMMEEVARLGAEFDIPVEVSLESIMGCGIGACWGCVKKIKKGRDVEWIKICSEGPVFDASEVVWHETPAEGR